MVTLVSIKMIFATLIILIKLKSSQKYTFLIPNNFFFDTIAVEGYKKPQVHVEGDLSGLNKEDIHRVLESVSDIVHCKIEDILLNGGDILH